MIKTRLKNGITVIFEKRPTNSIALEVQVKVGSVKENKKQAGMTHLIEHLLFEGTKTRTAHEISNSIESVGGEFNAATSHERTFYYIHIPKQYFIRALDIMSDIIQNPLFSEKTIKKEKNVVLNEIKFVEDDPKSYLWVLFLKTLFTKHKAKNPIHGNVKAIKKMSQTDISSYYNKHYIPQNMTISLVGNINNPMPLIRKKFESMPRKSLKYEAVEPKTLLHSKS